MSNRFSTIDYEIRNRVASITLNSPETLNAINQQMRFDLNDAILAAEADDDARLVVLKGAGRGFCSGADLREGMLSKTTFVEQCAVEWKPWLTRIHDSKKLYIAAVHGPCAGIGTALAMICDFMVMSEDAYLYQAFSAIGLIPDGGANWLLINKLGYQRALELAVNAGRLDAQECLQLGLANHIVAVDELANYVQTWAEKMAQGAPLAQASAKQIMRRAASMNYAETIDAEAQLQDELIASDDAKRAVTAFLNKTKVEFEGR